MGMKQWNNGDKMPFSRQLTYTNANPWYSDTKTLNQEIEKTKSLMKRLDLAIESLRKSLRK